MAKSQKQATDEIKQYIMENGGDFGIWYVGITNNPNRRLFDEHMISKDTDLYIFMETEDFDTAFEVERYFIDEKGTKGEPGRGRLDSKCVYACKKK